MAESFVGDWERKRRRLNAPVGSFRAGISRKWRWRGGWRRSRAVLILDEPTQGVDVGAKAEIHRLMGELAGRGIGDPDDFVGAAGDSGHERPDRGDARGDDRRDARPSRGDAGDGIWQLALGHATSEAAA